MGPSDGDEPGGWCRVEPGGWVRRRRRAEPLDRDRLVERVLALATKRSADARRARDALRAFRAALGTRDEANRARMASREPATALLAAARITKRLASGPEDLKAVERLLRAAASVTADGEKKAADDSGNQREASSRRAANVELGVLLCQEGRDAEAAALLTAMGFRYRLARGVLRYPSELAGVAVRAKKRNARDGASLLGDEDEKPTPTNDVPVRAFDGAVPPGTLARLRRVFAPDSAFWEEHGYHEDGCGFFSYAHDLTESPERFSSPRSQDAPQDAPPRSLMDAVIRACAPRGARVPGGGVGDRRGVVGALAAARLRPPDALRLGRRGHTPKPRGFARWVVALHSAPDLFRRCFRDGRDRRPDARHGSARRREASRAERMAGRTRRRPRRRVRRRVSARRRAGQRRRRDTAGREEYRRA